MQFGKGLFDLVDAFALGAERCRFGMFRAVGTHCAMPSAAISPTQPNAELAAKNLIELGAKALIFMPIGFATENHETLLDVEHIIEGLRRKHSHVNYVQMACVNDHPEFCQMAADWAEEHIEALLSQEALSVNSSVTISYTHSSHHHHHHHDHHHH